MSKIDAHNEAFEAGPNVTNNLMVVFAEDAFVPSPRDTSSISWTQGNGHDLEDKLQNTLPKKPNKENDLFQTIDAKNNNPLQIQNENVITKAGWEKSSQYTDKTPPDAKSDNSNTKSDQINIVYPNTEPHTQIFPITRSKISPRKVVKEHAGKKVIISDPLLSSLKYWLPVFPDKFHEPKNQRLATNKYATSGNFNFHIVNVAKPVFAEDRQDNRACYVQTCDQTITGRQLGYTRALEIVQNEEYLEAADTDLIRRNFHVADLKFASRATKVLKR